MRHVPSRGLARAARLSLMLAAFAAFPSAVGTAAEHGMLDQIGPDPEPRAVAPAAPETPAVEQPLEARPNTVVPGGLTVDLQGRGEHPFTATVGPDGTVHERCGHAAGKE